MIDKKVHYSPEMKDKSKYQKYVLSSEDETDIYFIAENVSLTEAKEMKYSEIETELQNRLNQGYTFNGWEFDSNLQSVLNVAGITAVLSAKSVRGTDIGSIANYLWRDKTKTRRSLTTAQLMEMGDTLENMMKSVYDTAFGLFDQIDAATTVTEVETIVWI